MTSESTRYAWGALAGLLDTSLVPRHLDTLLRVSDEGVWKDALFTLDRCATDLSIPSEATAPIVASLLSLMLRVDRAKRVKILESVEEMVCGPMEEGYCETQLRWLRAAREEVLLAFRPLVDLMDGGWEAEAEQCVLLLGHCGRQRPTLAARIDGYIRACVHRLPGVAEAAAASRPEVWAGLTAFGDPSHIPRWLDLIARADTQAERRSASEAIERVATDQGVPCAATAQVVSALLSFLPAIAAPNRSAVLSLLEELTCGRGRDSYSAAERQHLELAVAELVASFATIAALLQGADETDARECIDLLAYCAELRPELADRVDASLERAAARLPSLRPEVDAVRAYHRRLP